MRLRTIEYVAGVMAIAVPVCVVIWVGARTIDRLDDGLNRIDRLETRVSEMAAEQVEDDLVNEAVASLQESVKWLTFHHHSVPQGGDTGRAHVD